MQRQGALIADDKSLLQCVAYHKHRPFTPPLKVDLLNLISDPGIADCVEADQTDQKGNPDRAGAKELHEDEKRNEKQGPAATQVDAPSRGHLAIQQPVERTSKIRAAGKHRGTTHDSNCLKDQVKGWLIFQAM